MVALIVAAATPAAPSATAQPTSPPTYAFGPTGVHGGGFQNVIAVHPAGDGRILLGGDVSGFSRSSDRGRSWVTSNRGVPGLSMRAVASVAYSPGAPQTVFAAVGYQGLRGGFLASVDGGATWEVRSTVPQFSGSSNAGVGGVPAQHPRSTGALIAVDDARSLLYVATFDDGVMRSADGGFSWTRIGLAGSFLRSIVLDPADPDRLFVATYGDGVWRSSAASGEAVFERMTGAPAVVEELAYVGADLYAAAGPNGVYRVTDAGQTWTKLGAGSLPDAGPSWTAIAGAAGCGEPTLYAASHAGGGAWSLARSADGGSTWTPVSDATIATTIGGPDGTPWWLAPKRPQMMLGASGYTAGQLAVLPAEDPCGNERVLLAGRSGVWGSTDAGASWYPMVEDLGTTVTHAVEADPAVPARVSAGVSDWGQLFSTDGFAHVTMSLPAGVTDAFDVAFDGSTTPSRVLLAMGHTSSNTKGEVFSSTDPVAGAWIDEGLSDAAGNKRVLAVVAGRNGSGTGVIVAAVQGGGVWRKVGQGAWQKGTGKAMSTAQKTNRASLTWPSGSTTVYLYDRQSGVWRSNDAGAAWTLIWAKKSASDMTGFVAAAAGDPATLYVSVGNAGVFRIDGATSGTVGKGLTAVPIGPTPTPGPIAVDGTSLIATRLAGPGGLAQLFLSTDRGASWTAIGDERYQASALNPRDVWIASDGTISVALNGAGVLRGTPSV